MMKKLLFTLMMLVGTGIVMAQNTYYWTGTATTATLTHADWKTNADGTGTSRADNANDADILIVNGKTVVIDVTNPAATNNNITLRRLEVLGGADVTFRNDGTVTQPTTLTLAGVKTPTVTKSLLVSGASTLRLVSKTTSAMNMSLTCGGDIEGVSSVYIEGEDYTDAGTSKQAASRLQGSTTTYPLVFSDDSKTYCLSAASAFGANSTGTVNAVVFNSGTSLYYQTGGSPFGNTANTNPILEMKAGSSFYYQHPDNPGNLLKGRSFANLIIENIYKGSNADTFTSVDNLTIKNGGSIELSSSTNANNPIASQIVTGNVVIEGGGLLNMGVHLLIGSGTFTTQSGATVIVANAGGIEGAITTTGTKTFDANTIYGFNTGSGEVSMGTLLPTNVPTNSGVVQIGGLLVGNFRIILNKSVNITANGKLYLNNNSAAIRLSDYDLTLQPGVEIQRVNNNNSRIWTHEAGVLTVIGITDAKLIPVGNNGQYAPVELSATNSSDFTIKIEANTTSSVTRPASFVNVRYTIKRVSGTGNFKATLTWPSGLETGSFAGLANNNISLYAFDSNNGNLYTVVQTESADNTAKTITATLSDGGTFIVGEGPNTLPVTLSAFTAQKQGNSALIKWTTSSENSSSHFNIERSTNGTDFTIIGSRKGAGTTSVAQYYSYTDYSPAGGTNYYRLVQYDLNGTPTVTGPQVLNFNNNTQGLLVQTGQNIQEVAFYVNSAASGKAQVAVYAIDGKKVAQGTVNVDKGNNTCTLNIPSLGRGVYTLVYQLGNENYRAKFVK